MQDRLIVKASARRGFHDMTGWSSQCGAAICHLPSINQLLRIRRKQPVSPDPPDLYETTPMRPLIGLPTDTFTSNDLLYFSTGGKYTRAVSEVALALPVLLPAAASRDDLKTSLRQLHGIVITGAPSNVHPRNYAPGNGFDAKPYDEQRDALTLPLIELALEAAVPLLAICRGTQELNVALGGTLLHNVHLEPGKLDHLGDMSADVDVKYGPRHEVAVTQGGKLAGLLGERANEDITVNSVHRQAIGKLAPDLAVEAMAPDGVIEAVSVTNAENFALGVQWHPEYDALDNPQSRALFEAFGDAARNRLKADRC